MQIYCVQLINTICNIWTNILIQFADIWGGSLGIWFLKWQDYGTQTLTMTTLVKNLKFEGYTASDMYNLKR